MTSRRPHPLTLVPTFSVALAVLGGCSQLSGRSVAYPSIAERDPTVSVEAAGEPLSPAQGERLIERAAAVDDSTLLERVLAVEEALTKSPLVAGNAIELLVDGPDTYEAMFDAISKAEHHVHLETYILADDEVGQQLADILIDRRKHGVAVRIIYDWYGSMNTSAEFIETLEDHGVEVHEFRPADPRLWRIDNRDHRKILVVDGRVGFTGGMNVSGVYESSSFSAPEPAPSLDGRWRDTHVRIDGPAVAELQKVFLRLWSEEGPEGEQVRHETDEYFPKLEPAGADLVRIIATDGGDEEYEIYEAYMAAIEHARERIWITQAYFAPNDDILEALEDAARRGVDVRVLVPGLTDQSIVLNASRSMYDDLLEAGVHIYERRDAMVHAKTAVIDGVWSTVGSSNFDYRSFLHNHEANAVIISREFGRQMEDLFQVDIDHSVAILREEWENRSWADRIIQDFSRLFTYWI